MTKLVVLTIEHHVPYEGTDNELIGVYSSVEQAKLGMLRNYEEKVGQIKSLLKDYPTDKYYQNKLREFKVPTEENHYTYYDKYASGSYQFEEVELDK